MDNIGMKELIERLEKLLDKLRKSEQEPEEFYELYMRLYDDEREFVD